ncbi:MAG: ATP-binding cassette domain-containing protein [Clostridia bacterium]|nr:ATP-binding cassette domain-containing protein [Clostridia bacterium]
MLIKIDEKKYGDKTVYKNFSLSVAEGKITCILGESGSGKTTLLNCVAGLSPFVGEIPALKCSCVFQTPRLVPNLTVLGNLRLVCNDENLILKTLDDLHLSDKKDAYPKTLSGGQSQRVALARALVYGGEIMLLDEPFSSLDLKLKMEISALFKNLQRQKNITSLFVTHDADEALSLGDEIIVIKNGAIILKKERSQLTRDALISALIEN